MKLLTKRSLKRRLEQFESKPAYTPPTIPFPESLFMEFIPEARLNVHGRKHVSPANIN